jgi:undecaprenyl-diphosphatase
VSDTLSTVILGIVEGVTEFLPISSTGHLLIAEQFLGERSDLFNIAIQSGAILAVVLIYWNRLTQLLLDARNPQNRDYLYKLSVTVLITLVLGFVATKLGFKLPATVFPIAIATLVGGVAILVIEQYLAPKPKSSEATWSVAIWVALGQITAGLLPGTSRSGATIFAAMLAGMTLRPAATEFSFLVGIPVMFAATAFELLKARHEVGAEAGPATDWSALALGFAIAGVVAFVVVKWLLRYVQSHRFTVFAWYRILLGIALLVMLHMGVVH